MVYVFFFHRAGVWKTQISGKSGVPYFRKPKIKNIPPIPTFANIANPAESYPISIKRRFGMRVRMDTAVQQSPLFRLLVDVKEFKGKEESSYGIGRKNTNFYQQNFEVLLYLYTPRFVNLWDLLRRTESTLPGWCSPPPPYFTLLAHNIRDAIMMRL